MRIPFAELCTITRRARPSAQARWFEKNYGVTLAHDSEGVILTPAAWEGLVAKQCGLAAPESVKPVLVLRKTNARH